VSSAPPKTNTQTDEIAELRARAEQGDAEAQYNIGVMYSDGRGVPQDETQATAWFRKAAEQGHTDAQFCLGVMYENGLGVPRDNAQAVVWYCRAAEHGDADALFELGVMYAFGQGVPQNFVEAFMWMHLATCRATGREDKKRYMHGRTAVANWLTRAQMTEARKLAFAATED
jgi:TPR repeat protein